MLNNNLSVPSDTGNEYIFDISHLRTNLQGVNILQINARSIRSMQKLDSFKMFLDNSPTSFDVIVVCESWIKREETGLYNIPGFSSLHSCGNGYGGIALYISVCFNFKTIEILENELFSISVAIKVSAQLHIKLTAYYRPPYQSNFSLFLQHLKSNISNTSDLHIIVGDINIDLLTLNSSIYCNQYLNLIESFGYTVSNSFKTRPISNTLIDHVVVNFCQTIPLKNITIENSLSDHNAIASHLSICSDKHTYVKKKKVNYTDLFNLLESTLTDYDFSLVDDVNTSCGFLVESIQSAIQRSTNEIIKKVKLSHSKAPWVTYSDSVLIKRKNRAYNKFKLDRSNIYLKRKLDSLNKEVNNRIKSSKLTYFHNLFANSKGNSKNTWNKINCVLGKNSKPRSSIDALCDPVSGQFITDKAQIANELNLHFVSGSQQPSLCSNMFNLYGSCFENNHCLFLSPTDDVEVNEIIKNLSNGKSVGLDGISNEAIKFCSRILVLPLVNIFNSSLSHGIYPNCLKYAKVIPIYKSGEKTSCSNYRPISVLPAINKIFERLLFKRLSQFLLKHNFFFSRQFGFRVNSGTHIATTELVNEIILNIENKNIVSGIFLDLSKAFDCVNHSILLEKLNKAGVRGLALKIFQDYLANRIQKVFLDSTYSNEVGITVGVPQGSVLGPLLFLIFINDVHKLDLLGSIQLYADDSALFYSSKNVDLNLLHMKTDLKLLKHYFEINHLNLNVKKTKLIHFRSTHSRVDCSSGLFFENEVIPVSDSVVYLGLHMDQYLRWDVHITYVCSKLAAKVGILRKLKTFMPTDILLSIYYAFIHSNLSYLMGVWGCAGSSYLRPVEVLQKRALKFVFKLPLSYPSIQLFSQRATTVLNLKSMYFYCISKFVFNTIKNTHFCNATFISSNHNHHTRYKFFLTRVALKTTLGCKCISFAGPTFYNLLPISIRNSNTANLFAVNVRRWLLSQQQCL